MSCFFCTKGNCYCINVFPAYILNRIIYLCGRISYWQDSVNYWLSSINTNKERARFHKRMYNNRSEYSVFNTEEAEYALSSLDNYNYYIERNKILATDLDMAKSSYNEFCIELLFTQLFAIMFRTLKNDSA